MRRLRDCGIALIAGAALVCAFAPLNLWFLAILCPAVLMWLWEGRSAREAALSGFCFNAATFGCGTSWMYIGVHDYSGAPVWIAAGLVVGLTGIMAAYQALLGFLSARLLPSAGPWRWLVGVPALWLLIEWFRGWFLSGFPWLALGYSQTDTALAGFAPVVGVYGISALLLTGSGALLALWRGSARVRLAAILLLTAPWPIGWALRSVPWTRPDGPPISVAVLQGAVPEDLKWQTGSVEPTRDLYTHLNDEALGARLIVWPEAALPQLANEVTPYLKQLYARAQHAGSDIVMGILRADEKDDYHNSILVLSSDPSFYDKHHLVPFAEFFPVPRFVRTWLRLMNLPYSDFEPGPAGQPSVAAAGTRLALGICYEDAYPTADLPAVRTSGVLVNVTNDAWFGHSWARFQHFQLTRMRALEAQRPVVRAANDGISALVGPHGQVLAQAEQFKPAVLHGTVQPQSGLPPFIRTGNWPVVVLGLLGAGLAAGIKRRPVPASDGGNQANQP
jgi:apolipoprotein N-acyltransferase